MKNITVLLDDDLYRRFRVRAAELGTSVSALVRDFLGSLVDAAPGDRTEERRRRRLHEIVAEFEAQGVGLRSTDNLFRDELYDRGRGRAKVAAAKDQGRDPRQGPGAS